jgi:hypothetical protein
MMLKYFGSRRLLIRPRRTTVVDVIQNLGQFLLDALALIESLKNLINEASRVNILTIPLKKPFLEFLKIYLSGKTGCVLAPDKRKGKGTYRFDPNRRVRSHFRSVKVRCTWHDMRRSFASNLVSKGESIYIVAIIMVVLLVSHLL